MNKKFTITLALILFITCISLSSKAQKIDYVITNKGDTLAGQIIGERMSWFKFKSQTDTKFQKFTASEVAEYRTDKKRYFSKVLPGEEEPTFVMRFEDGPISLYQYLKYTNPAGNNYILRWYASKNNGPLVELKSNWGATTSREERKENFEALISDNAIVLSKYKAAHSYSFDIIESLVKNYNMTSMASNKSQE